MVQANWLQNFWIVISTWCVTLWYSCRTIYFALTSSEPRPVIDREIRRWARKILRLTRMEVTFKGKFPEDDTEKRSYIIMCNHSSVYDIPLSFLAIPGSLRMLTKIELFSVPIFGRALRLAEFIAIDRHSHEQALKDLQAAKEKMKSGIFLWVAPEGTRSKNGQLLPFKKGGFHLAFDTEAIIVPLIIRGVHEVLPSNGYRMKLKTSVEVIIDEPIDTRDYQKEGEEKAMRDQLMKKMREVMFTRLNAIEQTPHKKTKVT